MREGRRGLSKLTDVSMPAAKPGKPPYSPPIQSAEVLILRKNLRGRTVQFMPH
jgi:hypothetical protein